MIIKIKGDNIIILEIGPRLGGDFITSHLVPLSTNVNMEDQLIRIATGLPYSYKFESKASLVSYLDFKEGSKVERTVSEAELRKQFPEIDSFEFNLQIGEEIRKIVKILNEYGT